MEICNRYKKYMEICNRYQITQCISLEWKLGSLILPERMQKTFISSVKLNKNVMKHMLTEKVERKNPNGILCYCWFCKTSFRQQKCFVGQ